jgi:hypothetical protein
MANFMQEHAEQIKRGMELCLENRIVLPAVILLFSGVDAFGFLDSNEPYAIQKTFVAWAEKYMDGFLKKKGINGLDLYSARCGLLHTGQAPSKLVDSGQARELWYRFGGEWHVNVMTNTPQPPVLIDVEEFVGAFNNGVEQFIMDAEADPALMTRAIAKERFFRRGLLLGQ